MVDEVVVEVVTVVVVVVLVEVTSFDVGAVSIVVKGATVDNSDTVADVTCANEVHAPKATIEATIDKRRAIFSFFFFLSPNNFVCNPIKPVVFER